jgi:hypothetical protein
MLEGSKNQLLRSTEGTYHFLAPECATGLEYDPYRVDIWALGVTMYVMLQGTLPFGDGVSSLTQVMESIQKDDFKCSPEIEQECVHLLRRLLEKDPINRITIEELKQYPWLEMKKRTQRVVNNKNKIIEVTQQEIDAAFTPVNNFILMAKLKMKMNSRLYKARKSLGARNNIVILNEKLEDVSTKESDCQGEIQKERPTTMKKKNSRNYDIRSPRNEPIENLASTSQGSAPVCIRRESRSEAIEMPIERSSASEQTSTASSIPLLVKKQSSKKLITGEVHPILIKKTSKSQVGAIEYLTALQAASSLTRKPQHNNEENSCCDDKTSVLINKTSNCKLAGEGKTLAQTASVEAESSERITRTSQGREDCESDLSVDNGEENVNESVSISTTLCSVTSKELQPSVSRSIKDIIAATGEKEVPVIKVEAEIIKGTSPMETSLSKEELVTQQNNISAAGTPLICTTAQDEKVISQSIKSLDSSFSQMTSKNPNIGDEKGQTPPYDNISNNEVHVVKIKSHDREILKIEGTVSLELLLDTTKSSGPVKPPLPKHQNSIMAALDALAHEPSSNESNDPLVKKKSGKKQYETEGITLFGFPLTNSRKKNSFIAPTLDDEHGAPLVDTHGIMMMNLLRCKSSSNDPNQTTSSDTVIPFDNKYAPSGSIKSQDENSVADDRNDKQINQNIVLKSVIVQVKPSNHHFKTNCSIM